MECEKNTFLHEFGFRENSENCNLNKSQGKFLSVDRKSSELRRLENITDFLVDFSGDFVEAKIMRHIKHNLNIYFLFSCEYNL